MIGQPDFIGWSEERGRQHDVRNVLVDRANGGIGRRHDLDLSGDVRLQDIPQAPGPGGVRFDGEDASLQRRLRRSDEDRVHVVKLIRVVLLGSDPTTAIPRPRLVARPDAGLRAESCGFGLKITFTGDNFWLSRQKWRPERWHKVRLLADFL